MKNNAAETVAIKQIVNLAMRDAWNNICDDTGHHPLDIERTVRGGNLMFSPNHWADLAGEIVAVELAKTFQWQDEIDRRDDIINSDRIVIADIVDQNCSLRVQLASMRITFGTILAIADTHGCRIETAMDGCDKIMELCREAMLPSQDISGNSVALSSHSKEYKPLFGLTAEEKEHAPPLTHDTSGKRIDGYGDPAKGEYNAFLGDDGSDIPCD